ncbi:Asp-tRNA(Asn)/Glu-tRNA(Gln) amidotransferase GatCAB subunit A [Hydrogenibacillus schlegelii]|uniref:Glutamyl-tRNA amidotransferase n=1 Tax=Hydrogenibacillus schlegelii TaxID=1484 RepID=A0A179ITD7_HYDSH|nr:Asp-tRNA(Asn)/Glu-tRNA(Gln) amidotransferase GatCAB subunit A [Hydrogenibacillus schlegelii]OAR04851.1 glutamyl-tRNA amidotransferase [Hydrogenibacillus schlegelii]
MDVLALSIQALADRIRARAISIPELVGEVLREIRNRDPELNAYVTICEDGVQHQAKRLQAEIDRGRWRGPLHGIPIAVKDMVFTRGCRTTMGSKVYAHFVPDDDATVIRKLKRAGAVIIGKTNTHEFAFGPTGDRSLIGPTRNPFDKRKISGGSSGGSGVAVAARLAFAAVGTDTGGSIRIPASANGIVGLKPTFGLVSRSGVFPLSHSLDHVGPMTRDVIDNALLLQAMVGFDPKDPHSVRKRREDYLRGIGRSIRGRTVGVSAYFSERVEAEVLRALEKAIDVFEALGAKIERLDLRPEFEAIVNAQQVILQAEAYAVHETTVREHPDLLDPEVYERLVKSKEVSGYKYVQAMQKRKEYIHLLNKTFEKIDVLLTPTLPILPPEIGQREVNAQWKEPVREALLRFTSPFNYTGHPSLSIPCGWSKSGLPIGCQLVGQFYHEALLYQFAYAFEKARE